MLNAISGGAAQNVGAVTLSLAQILDWCQEFADRRVRKRLSQLKLVLKTKVDPGTAFDPRICSVFSMHPTHEALCLLCPQQHESKLQPSKKLRCCV